MCLELVERTLFLVWPPFLLGCVAVRSKYGRLNLAMTAPCFLNAAVWLSMQIAHKELLLVAAWLWVWIQFAEAFARSSKLPGKPLVVGWGLWIAGCVVVTRWSFFYQCGAALLFGVGLGVWGLHTNGVKWWVVLNTVVPPLVASIQILLSEFWSWECATTCIMPLAFLHGAFLVAFDSHPNAAPKLSFASTWESILTHPNTPDALSLRRKLQHHHCDENLQFSLDVHRLKQRTSTDLCAGLTDFWNTYFAPEALITINIGFEERKETVTLLKAVRAGCIANDCHSVCKSHIHDTRALFAQLDVLSLQTRSMIRPYVSSIARSSRRLSNVLSSGVP